LRECGREGGREEGREGREGGFPDRPTSSICLLAVCKYGGGRPGDLDTCGYVR